MTKEMMAMFGGLAGFLYSVYTDKNITRTYK